MHIKRNGFLPPIEFYSWFAEHPDLYEKYKNGGTIEVPEYLANNLDCDVVDSEEVQEIEQEDIEYPDLDDLEKENFKKKLLNIKGIGESRANDLVEEYIDEEALRKGLKENSIDLSDSILEKLKEEFFEGVEEIEYEKGDN